MVPVDNWRSLDPKVRMVWRFSALISGVSAGAFLLFLEWLIMRKVTGYPLPFGLWGVGGLVLFGLPGLIFANLSWKNAKYRLGEDDLAYAKGIFWKSERYVNRARIQHVDITAGPVSRMLGLVEVGVHVGTGATSAISISGLTPEIAEHLKKSLLEGSMVKFQEALAGQSQPPVAGASEALPPPVTEPGQVADPPTSHEP